MKLPSYEIDHYELDNVEKLQESHSGGFWIPDKTKRQNLNIGDVVKLSFRMQHIDSPNDVSIECMWVQIKELKDGFFIGTLDNGPYDRGHLQYPKKVVFKPEHVMDIYDETDSSFLIRQ